MTEEITHLSREDQVERVASMLADWEASGELYTEFARRLVDFIRPADRLNHGHSEVSHRDGSANCAVSREANI